MRFVRPIALLFAGLTLLGLGSATRMLLVYYEYVNLTFFEALTSGLVDWYLWGLFVPVVLWAGLRAPLVREALLPRTLLHLGLGPLVSFGQLALFATVSAWLRGHTVTAGDVRSAALMKFHSGVFVYGCAIFALSARHAGLRARAEELRRAQLAERLSDARLQSLQAHLRPHFLFNTLNSVAALMRRDPDEAERMLARLGTLLRRSVRGSNAQAVQLVEEVSFVRDYLEIESARFGERLQTEFSIPESLHGASVPPLLLQPLVENAVRHGLSERIEGGCVRLSATSSGETLHLVVENDGPELEEDASGGIGLGGTRERLQLLYGDRAHLHATSSDAGVRVEVTLPLDVIS